VVGLGRAGRIVRIEVRWPRTGEVQVVEGVGLDAAMEIVEGRPGFSGIEARKVGFRRG